MFKPFKHFSEIDTMDEEVLWEHKRKLAEDMPIEEVNAFFRDYVKKYGRNKWQDQN